MTSNFQAYKQNRLQSLEKIQEATKNLFGNYSNQEDDKDYWKFEPSDKLGNGYAEIRFLPDADPDDIPYIKYWDHSFFNYVKGQKRWYINRSRTSLGKGETDPVFEMNGELWDHGEDSDERKQASKQKRNLRFVSNILVLKYSHRPEDEGKVFKFKFGKRIFQKLEDKMNPASKDEEPINPFDLFTGCTFKLKRSIIDKQVNYNNSEFLPPSALYDGDEEKLAEVFEKLFNLKDELNPKKYKSYDQLKKNLNWVLGTSEEYKEDSEEVKEAVSKKTEVPKTKEKSEPKVKKEEKKEEAKIDHQQIIDETEEVDEDEAFFKNLGNLIEDDE